MASVLSQTYQHIELIIIDDGSTDATPSILRRTTDPRVRVVTQPNMGLGFSVNRAIALARGDYVGGIGHDDVFLPEKTEVQLRTMRDRGWDFCFTWAEIIDAGGHRLEHPLAAVFNQTAPPPAEAFARFARGNFLCAPSALTHRRCRTDFPANIALFCLDDYHRWLGLWRRFSGGVLEQPLVRYRIHGDNTSLDPRFPPEYRGFERRAAVALALAEAGHVLRPRPFWTAHEVQRLRRQAEWLMTSGDPAVGLFAYVAANRALNLAPLDPQCYTTLSEVLSCLGYAYPATLLAERARRVESVDPDPPPRTLPRLLRLYRPCRPWLAAATGGRWVRLEARLQTAIDGRGRQGW